MRKSVGPFAMGRNFAGTVQGGRMAKDKKIDKKPKSKKTASAAGKRSAGARQASLGGMESGGRKRPIVQYTHDDKERLNNPPVGLVDTGTDSDATSPKKQYAYDPHIDPALQWAGKAERLSFEVDTVSLHVHERIDPKKIIEAIKKKNGGPQVSMFETPGFNPPLREAVEFYKHKHGWSNRLIAGDSLLVMNSLIEKEGLGGHVQMVYIDPPYGIKYGSNFQPFVNKRDVKDGKDDDLTAEPEMVKAFRDTWELGIHSYLTYLRDRFLLARELLADTGSIFVQISDENVHLVRNLLDEVFGRDNFISQISFRKKTMPLGAKSLEQMHDMIVWYSRDKKKIKYRDLYKEYSILGAQDWKWLALPDGTKREMTKEEFAGETRFPEKARVYRLKHPSPLGENIKNKYPYEYEGITYEPPANGWGVERDKLDQLVHAERVQPKGNMLNYILFFDDFPITVLTNPWNDTVGPQDKKYVVQTSDLVIQRCLLMTTDPGDLVLDITCGSGTTAYVAEQWGRRWITCDTSRVATALAKQRLMTATFDYYELAHPHEGVGSGFNYKTVPHVTLKSIANNPEIKEGMSKEQIERAIARYAEQETLYDQPIKESGKVRVTGPFTVEAVPAPTVKSIDEIDGTEKPQEVDVTIARSGATLRQSEWCGELLRTGIRGKKGQKIGFSRVETLPGTRWLHADADTKSVMAGVGDGLGPSERVVISFGPEHAPLEQRQVEHAIEEAHKLVPKPKMIVFAAFQFDPEAAKDIDETEWPGVTLLKAQMNADLLTEDLKKKRSSNESFWLIGQPDVRLEKIKSGEDKGKYRVTVHGFDYYNTKTGNIDSGDQNRIAMWMLDPDYDGRCIFPRQVFFPMADEKEGWSKLAKNLKAEIDPDLASAYTGTKSLPFEAGEHKRAAVKIIDDRGIESLKLLDVE